MSVWVVMKHDWESSWPLEAFTVRRDAESFSEQLADQDTSDPPYGYQVVAIPLRAAGSLGADATETE